MNLNEASARLKRKVEYPMTDQLMTEQPMSEELAINHVHVPRERATVTRKPIDEEALILACAAGEKDPRFAAWSRPGKIMLEYLANTERRFRLSKEVAKHLEAGLAAEYPEVWAEIISHLNRRQQ